jgi:hypothetical protein
MLGKVWLIRLKSVAMLDGHRAKNDLAKEDMVRDL